MTQQLLDVDAVATILSVSPKWVRRRIGDGDLPFPYLKVGRHLRFRPEDVEAYLAACVVEPRADR